MGIHRGVLRLPLCGTLIGKGFFLATFRQWVGEMQGERGAQGVGWKGDMRGSVMKAVLSFLVVAPEGRRLGRRNGAMSGRRKRNTWR